MTYTIDLLGEMYVLIVYKSKLIPSKNEYKS